MSKLIRRSFLLNFGPIFSPDTSQKTDCDKDENERYDVSLKDNDKLYFCLAVYFPIILITNFATMFMIKKDKRLHSPQHMIIFVLCLIDFIIGLDIPLLILLHVPETKRIFREEYYLCLIRYTKEGFLICTSLYFHFILCIERFAAINFPFWYHLHKDSKIAAIATIGFTFIYGICIHVVLFIALFDFDETELDLYMRCDFYNGLPQSYSYYVFGSIIVVFVLAILMSMSIVVTLHKKRSTDCCGKSRLSNDENLKISHHSLKTKTTIFLMFLFVVLWMPIPFAFIVKSNQNMYFYDMYVACSAHCAVLNSTLNPFVLAYTRPLYRIHYKYLFTHGIHNWRWLENNIRELEQQEICKNYVRCRRKGLTHTEAMNLKNTFHGYEGDDKMNCNISITKSHHGVVLCYDWRKSDATKTSANCSAVDSQAKI